MKSPLDPEKHPEESIRTFTFTPDEK